jgi:hypothetical protein
MGEKEGNRDWIEGSKKGLKRRSTDIGTGEKRIGKGQERI